MENKKLKININLKTGKYIFDDGEKIFTTLMKSGNISLISEMNSIRDEIIDEYGFSAEMISRVDPILYQKLKEYDAEKGTRYTTRYLNVAAKEIEREENEPMGVYLERCTRIRKKALEGTGIEIDYVMATRAEMKNMSLIEKLEVLRMAKRQTAIGATISEKSQYDEDKIKNDESIPVVENQVKEVEAGTESKEAPVQVVEANADGVTNESVVEPEIITEPKMAIPSFLQSVLDKREIPDTAISAEKVIDTVDTDAEMRENKIETPKVDTATEQPMKKEKTKVSRKTLSRRQTIQASKKAMRESRKMKNIYKQKLEQANKPQVAATQKQKSKAKAKPVADKEKKDVEFIPIKDGKMVGIDENRPSAIVRTFVLENPKKVSKEEVKLEQEEATPKAIIVETPKQEGIVRRYTRKLKNKADAIKNRMATSKDRLRRAAAVAAVGAVVIIAGILVIPKAIASIPLNTEQSSPVTIQAYDGVEKVSAKELEADAEAPVGTTVELERNDVSSYIRNIEMASAENVSEEENLSSGVPQTVEKIETETIVEETQSKVEEEIQVKDKEEIQEDGQGEIEQKDSKETTLESDSSSYLDSIRIGSRMKIDSGKYFANPDGSGKFGRFENHAGEAKILTIIGISTNDGYIPIMNDSGDVSLLELKQQYPDAKFSYHFEDENGHVLGWLTSESFENIAEQQVDDGMER